MNQETFIALFFIGMILFITFIVTYFKYLHRVERREVLDRRVAKHKYKFIAKYKTSKSNKEIRHELKDKKPEEDENRPRYRRYAIVAAIYDWFD